MDFLIDWTIKILDKFNGSKKDFAPEEAPAPEAQFSELTSRGFKKSGGGYMSVIEPPVEFSASSQQVAGLFPFCVGSSEPLIGTILGRSLTNGQPVTGDPVSLYLAGIISAPLAIVMGLNARGKSTLVQRMMLGIADAGFLIMALGDVKPDFRKTITALGGQVIEPGPELDAINPLDAGPLWHRIKDLEAFDAANGTRHAKTLKAEIHTRRVSTMQSLFRLSGDEKATRVANDSLLLSLAIDQADAQCMAENPPRQPLIEDVRQAVLAGNEAMRTALLTETTEEYKAASRDLVLALNVFNTGGAFGDVFSRQTTTEIDVTRSVDFDISSVRESKNKNLLAAVQIVCWAYGQAAIGAAKRLADVGLEPQRNYCVGMDELWALLEIDPEMIHHIDEITRLNRTLGIAQILITHTPKDFVFNDPGLTEKAKGFLERSPMKLYGALAEDDMEALDKVMPMTQREKNTLISWSPAGHMDPETMQVSPPIGRGKFLLKYGEGPGKPFQLTITRGEKEIFESDGAWGQAISRARSPMRAA